MIDYDTKVNTADTLFFYSDASKNANLDFGAVFENRWIYGQWETGFVKTHDPSIEFLELFTLVAAVLTWEFSNKLQNARVILFCKNEAVVQMVNNLTSSCKNCMYLLRILALNNMVHNQKITVRHVKPADNFLSDALSRLQFKRFWQLAPKGMNKFPNQVSELVWPLSSIWQKF